MHIMTPFVLFCLSWAAVAAQEAQTPTPAPGKLNLIIVEGEGAINNIKQRTSRETIVQVEDENHRPVAGAVVAFLLPDYGPSGTFVGGAKTATIVTDSAGRAVMPQLQTNQLAGQFQVHVTASANGQQVTATISQSNASGAASSSSAAHSAISGKTIGIIVGVAAAGAVGAAVGLHGGNKAQTQPATPSPPTGSISGAGTTVFGPHP
jgi:hypothetical protein